MEMTRRAALAAFASAGLRAAPPRLTLDVDGQFLWDGQRRFLLGSYMTPKPGGLSALKAAGFDFARANPTREALDAVAKAGLHAWTSVGSDTAKVRAAVESLRSHDALLFWETEDEPTFVWEKPLAVRVTAEHLNSARSLIRQLDPSRLCYLNHSPTNLVSTLRKYNGAGEMIATDIYPVIPHGIRSQYALWPDGKQGDFNNSEISQVGQYVRKMREVAGPDRAVFAVLQAFAWEHLRKDPNPKMVVYPTYAQTRFMAFQAIANGANGIIYWGLEFVPAGHGFWADLEKVTREIATLKPELAQTAAPPPAIEYHDTGHSLDRGIEAIIRGDLLIAVNADKNPVHASLRLPSGTRRVQFPPFGVEILRLSR